MSLLKLKKSSVSGKVPQPADLQFGELALNYADGILFYKNANNSIASISGGSGQVVPGSGGIIYVTKSSNYTAVDKDGILADTSAGSFTITLPASPTIGTQVFIADKANWGINNLTISGNGATIEGVVQDKIVDVGNISIHLVYNGTTWQLFAQPGIVSTLIEAGSVSDVFTRHSFTATSNQTVFPLVYTPGQVEVYVNGVLISTGDYTATNGTSIVFNSGVAQNSIVEIKKYSNLSLFTRESVTSTAGQTVIDTTYIPSLLEVYINGVLANSGDYTATNGTSIVFTQALPAGIVVDIKKYAGGSTFSRNVFTATAGQTTFPILYIKGLVEVYLNGVLANPKDYTAADGSNIVFNTPLTAGTLVYVKKFSLIPYGALDWNNLINKPVLGTAAATDASAYATAAQGIRADTAVQPNSLSTVATTGNYNDLLNKPSLTSLTSVDTVQFNPAYSGPTAVGQLSWNSGDGTLDLGLLGGNTVLQVGQEQVQRIWNNTGATLTEGQVVYITGAQGQRLTVSLAQANAESTSSKSFGIVTENILNQSEGYITTEGLVRNIDTSLLTQGAALWLSPIVPGLVTTTKPASPNHLVLVGFCVRQHQTAGSIFVKIQNGYELDELHDVLINGKANNDVLKYDAASGVWKNTQLGSVAYSNNYTDLLNKPTLGTAAATNSTDYATAAQGLKADTAVQPGSLATVATTGSYNDLLNKPTIPSITGLATETYVNTQVATKLNTSGGTITGNLAVNGILEIKDPANSNKGYIRIGTAGNGFPYVTIGGRYNTALGTTDPGFVDAWYLTAVQTLYVNNMMSLGGSLGTENQVASVGQYGQAIWQNLKTINGQTVVGTGSITGLATETYVDTRITNLINGAPAALDTLKEISDQLASDESAVASLVSVVATKANTSSLSTVATTGSYTDLLNKPVLGTAAATNTTAYATAAQGLKADTAVQPGSLATVATTGSYTDLLNKPVIGIKYVVKTTDYVAKDGDYILADTSSGSFGIALPASPTVGMQVVIADMGNWSVHTLGLGGNGATIDGVSSRTLSTGDTTVQCIYDGTTWKVYSFPNIIDSGSGTISDIFVRNTYALLFSQAIFKLNYTPGLVEVYINGVLIPRTEYTATNGTSITFSTAVPANSVVDIKRYSSLSLFTRTTVTTYANQSVFSIAYIPELLEVFVNGIMVNTNDYTASNGTQVVFNSGLPVNTIVEFKAYSGGSTFKNNIFTATAGQQTFLVQHVKEFTEVYLNGVLTTPEDYLSSNNSIWFYQPLAAGTLVYIKKFSKLAYGELDWGNITAKPTFATVATSGSYNDLLDKPISFSGSYVDLSNKPTLFSGAYADLTGKPALFSGSYTDLTNKPTIPSITGLATETYVDTRITNLINGAPAALDTLKEISDQLASDESAVASLVSVVATKANTSSLSTVATTGSYNDLLNKPTLFSGSYTDLTNKPTLFSGAYADLTGKPTLFSGSYTDLSNKPTLFSGAYADLIGKPVLATVATTGSYNDLLDKPAGGTTYIRKTANYTASDRDGIIADTSAGSFTVSLPATPTLGMQITIVDGDNWGANNLIVARNGSTIETAANDLTLDIPGVSVQFIYDGTTWEVFAQAGALSSIANPTATFVRTSYTATASQTTFAATYAVGLVEVFVNGLLLPVTDYTAANGTSIILNTGVDADSLVDIKSYSSSTASLLQTDWSTITNKPTLFSGAYADLTGKPTLFSGSYLDLTNKPTIPTVPTTISSFTNDSGYLTSVAGSSLTGTSLAANIVSSSLTSLGTLTSLTVTNNATVNGQVITPNRIGFRVHGSGTTSNLTTTQNTYGAINSNNFTVDFQQGTALNTTTGVFTAPVAGLYQVNIVARNAGYAGGISQLGVLMNGTSGGLVGGTCICMIEFAASSTMNHAGSGTVIKLAVGDTLVCKVLAGQINFDGNDNWSIAYLG